MTIFLQSGANKLAHRCENHSKARSKHISGFLPATGDGLRNTSHLVLHCEMKTKSFYTSVFAEVIDIFLPGTNKDNNNKKLSTFFPSLSLAYPSTTTESVIFSHGSGQLQSRCLNEGVTFKIAALIAMPPTPPPTARRGGGGEMP